MIPLDPLLEVVHRRVVGAPRQTLVRETFYSERMTQPDEVLDDPLGAEENGESKRTYVRSTIAFPYGDLDDAVAIAEIVYRNWGGQCPINGLAGELRQSPRSGAFRVKVSAAQMFGVVRNDHGILRITDLGLRVADDEARPAALVAAFKAVDLYAKLLNVYGGNTLPRDSGIEAEMVKQGVSPKQAERARQAFQRSAETAGFFRFGRERLVEPPLASSPTVGAVSMTAESTVSVAPPSHAAESNLHPLLAGLMRELPAEGQEFPADRRSVWLDTARSIFGLLYGKGDGEEENDRSGYPAHD